MHIYVSVHRGGRFQGWQLLVGPCTGTRQSALAVGPQSRSPRKACGALRTAWEALTCQELSDTWAMYYAGSPAALFAAKQNVKRGEFGAEGSNGRLGLHPYEAVCPCHAAPSLTLGVLRPVLLKVWAPMPVPRWTPLRLP